MSSYYWPPTKNITARATSITPWSSGLIVPMWYMPTAWSFFAGASGLTATPVSGTNGLGFGSAATDGVSGAWLCQYSGSLVNLSSGSVVTNYALPAADIMTGCAYSPGQGTVYTMGATGQVYAPSGGGMVAVTPKFGSAPTWGLAASGSSLFTMMPAVSAVGTLALSSSGAGVSGSIALPAGMPYPLCIDASTAASAIAVGGYTNATIACGFADLAITQSVAISGYLVGVSPSTNSIDLYRGINESYTFSQRLSGQGAPTFVTFGFNGASGFVSDPVSGKVSALLLTSGVLAISQTISVSAAAASMMTPADIDGLICQPGLNQVMPLHFTGSAWVTGTPLVLTNPQSAISTAASGAAVGFSSGVAFYTLAGSTWSLAASTALAFTPTALACDVSGNVFAAGSQGASGYLSIFSGTAVSQTITWPGSGVGCIYSSGQIVVGDPTVNLLRIFGGLPGAIAQQKSFAASAGLVNGMTKGTYTLFAPGSGFVSMYQFTQPYTIEPLRSGAVSVYATGSWAIASLGVGQWPEAVTFDVSGNVGVVTLQNQLYSVSRSGTVLASSAIAQIQQQPATVPIGLSDLAYLSGTLYASSSLNGALVKLP